MGDRTHWNDCWKERTHHDCAVARIYERDARIAELEAAQPVTLLAALDASIKRETHLGQLCGEAASRIAELEAERDALAHDVERHIAIVASVEAERDAAIERAVKAEKYVRLLRWAVNDLIAEEGER